MADEIKFHNSPTGPRKCTASKRPCKYAQAGQEHYATREEAQVAFDKEQGGSFAQGATKKGSAKWPKAPEAITQEEREAFELLEEHRELIAENEGRLAELKRHEYHYEGITTAADKLATVMQKPVIEFPTDRWNSPADNKKWAERRAAEGVIEQLQYIKTWVPNFHPHFPSQEYPDTKTLMEDVTKRVQGELAEQEALAEETKQLRMTLAQGEITMEAATGYKEDPKFGVPSGETTKSKFAGAHRPNYSTLPTQDVPVLKDSQRFCTKCQEPMEHKAGPNAYSGTWVHAATGDRACEAKQGVEAKVYGSVNSTCGYCGTGNPKHLTFKQEAYSDETSCSRCGGRAGRAIGD